MVKHEWAKLALRDLTEILAKSDKDASVIFTFDGEVLTIRCMDSVIATPALGNKWKSQYSIKAELLSVPKRLRRGEVEFSIFDSKLSIDNYRYPGVEEIQPAKKPAITQEQTSETMEVELCCQITEELQTDGKEPVEEEIKEKPTGELVFLDREPTDQDEEVKKTPETPEQTLGSTADLSDEQFEKIYESVKVHLRKALDDAIEAGSLLSEWVKETRLLARAANLPEDVYRSIIKRFVAEYKTEVKNERPSKKSGGEQVVGPETGMGDD